MLRHLAPFWCRQTIASIVRRKWWGRVLPRGRHASISGASTAHCASVRTRIPPPSVTRRQQMGAELKR
jgi:hypothetical protein